MVSGKEMVLMFLAAACFAVGGIFMKLSAGVSRPLPILAFLALFLVGALLQAFAMRRADLGVVYIAVLGLEAALALVFSIVLFHEGLSPARVLAVVLILVGVALLRVA
ncbi:multidrug efflux SMR transporter [Vitiosangium sp. GDMCC 1.1324]|uniref:DMT family transporter n=1 Tax=Vitiosangium sp. (strain GDMCC 1.1324) TaxID=2138576 RepID=UPI001E4AD4F5|nr:SMR family transporter [Vitiosangium sp. GDMCC 1.1324]